MKSSAARARVVRTVAAHFRGQGESAPADTNARRPWDDNPRLWAPPAPPVADPRVCRWCGAPRRELANGYLYCQSGCAPNDSPAFTGFCVSCDRQFKTGSGRGTDSMICAGCATQSAREARAMREAPHGGSHRDEWLERRRWNRGEDY